MTYFAFLALFVGIPILVLLVVTGWDARMGRSIHASLRHWSVWSALLFNGVLALIWTTPWDNYLVATRVWWYDPNLVTGITLGYVPIEEYTFFIVQPIMTGLFFALLNRRSSPVSTELADAGRTRAIALSVAGALWIGSIILLASGWQPGTYLGLELVWALFPMLIQFAFGADILWKHRRNIFITIAISTLYLSFADALAIQSGTWTINPEQSLNIYLGSVLPIEEFVFFLLTNTLVTFGMTLTMATESRPRLDAMIAGIRRGNVNTAQ